MFVTQISTVGSAEYRSTSQFAALIYKRRHDVDLEAFPDVLCSFCWNNQIVGCLGVTLGEYHDPLLLETYFSYDVLSVVSQGESRREDFGELGMRAVDEVIARECGIPPVVVSTILTAELVMHAHEIGLHHLLLTTSRVGRAIIRSLDAQLIELGAPDIKRKDASFRAKWENFFKVPQFCFGANIKQVVPGAARYQKTAPSVRRKLPS